METKQINFGIVKNLTAYDYETIVRLFKDGVVTAEEAAEAMTLKKFDR